MKYLLAILFLLTIATAKSQELEDSTFYIEWTSLSSPFCAEEISKKFDLTVKSIMLFDSSIDLQSHNHQILEALNILNLDSIKSRIWNMADSCSGSCFNNKYRSLQHKGFLLYEFNSFQLSSDSKCLLNSLISYHSSKGNYEFEILVRALPNEDSNTSALRVKYIKKYLFDELNVDDSFVSIRDLGTSDSIKAIGDFILAANKSAEIRIVTKE